jgi:hypothetical protein
MDLTLHNLSPELQQALLVRAHSEQRPIEDVLVDAAARELGITSSRSVSVSDDLAKETSESSRSDSQRTDTSKTTYTRNEFGAIVVRPATTDAAGNPLPKKRDLSFLAEGPPLEPEVLQALAEQRRIDPDLWQ